jgi:DNA-binding CsgD family transcriptional regulator
MGCLSSDSLAPGGAKPETLKPIHMAAVLSRPVESRAIADFLDSAIVEPSALVVEGEAGIGKTTLWMAGLEQAEKLGFLVLSASPAVAETVLAYAAVADMLAGVDPGTWATLPSPQRLAVDRVLLRTGTDDRATDPRAVAAGFVSLVKNLADQTPVLLAIDDLQWLDASSMQIVAFTARRLSGRVGVLGTIRTDPDGAGAASWLQLTKPEANRRIELGPLSLGGLREVLAERLGRSLPRPTMVRIHEVSRGNPFYALELARVVTDEVTTSEVPLPKTLADLVRARIGSLGAAVQGALLAASCSAAPTVELVARATGTDAEDVVGKLVDAEDKGIIQIDGHRVHFTHPLLARGVYHEATAAQRRSMHRNLADIVDEPELQAKHLAMAVAWGDPYTLQCLDKAAEMAHMRGAPAAAAEFLDRAVELGGDSPERRIRCARHHFEAGDFRQARTQLEQTIEQTERGVVRAEGLSLLATMNLLNGDFLASAQLLERALDEAGADLALRVPMLVTLSMAVFNAGQRAAATQSVEAAVEDAARLGQPHLLAQALAMREMLRFISGGGLDEACVQRAMELEDHHAATAVIFRPSAHNALFLAWTGELEYAHNEMASVRQHCIERGDESELIFVAVHSMLIEVWRGDFDAAAVIAEDAMERARQLGGDGPLSFALMMRATLAAYAGHVDDARRDANEALGASNRSYSSVLAQLPIVVLGFLEVSLEDYEAAATVLQPLLSAFDTARQATEIYVAAFLPDAIEALVHLGRLSEAEPMVDALECNGRRLDRAWMLAVGARCRSMLLAATGELDAAALAAQEAMDHHHRLLMPFERARTQLLLGQLQRRQRHRDAATTTLRDTLVAFEEMGTPLWADRARFELARATVALDSSGGLTLSEQRVAELAASGMTNRDVAAALFISPKTVEANLARIYRKLGIHSRAELGRLVGQGDG